MSQQRLIRGDNIGTRVDCGKDECSGRLDSAHDFDDDVCFANQFLGVRGQQFCGDNRVTFRFQVANGDTNELKTRTDSSGKLITVVEDLIRHLCTNTAGSQ